MALLETYRFGFIYSFCFITESSARDNGFITLHTLLAKLKRKPIPEHRRRRKSNYNKQERDIK